MPLNESPTLPLTGAEVAFRLHQRAFDVLKGVQKMAGKIRADVKIAINRSVTQETSDALGAENLAQLTAAYAGLKIYIESGGATCPDLPTLPSTTNP